MTTQQDLPAGTDAQVAITLDSCCKEDAHAVLAALHATFASDRSPEDVPVEPQGGPPIIWSATFDVSRTLGLAEPSRLTEPVVITAQGGYHAVDRLREALAEAFSVRVVGTSAGDQEEEVRLRLESPAAA